MNMTRALATALLALATLILMFLAGFGTHWLIARGSPAHDLPALADAGVGTDAAPTADFGVFWEAWHILQRGFFGDQPSSQQRTYGAIKGMVESYDDPYTVFVEPLPRQREKEGLSGEFGGIGAWIAQDGEGNFRLNPMPGRPAAKAGIVQDDILVEVAGAPVLAQMTQDEVVSLIRGPVGEPVELQVRREGTPGQLTFQVVRERIETPSVDWKLVEQRPQIGYIAIHQFTERTADELDQALKDLERLGAQQLVLDLRHNGGGLLQSSIDVASRFLSDGVVVFERKNDGSEETYRAVAAPRAPSWPMAVLVDGATASAAEIVAGALQDRGRATLVGDKTFGKGSVQLVYDLSDGSSVHVTVARWLTPNGHEIHGVGLTPDVPVSHSDERDAPLEEAIRILAQGARLIQPGPVL